MNSLHFAFAFALSVASVATAFAKEPAAPKSANEETKPVIILVHGALADATGWQHVIPLLEKDGYTVFGVQNSLFSLAEDVATTKRVIEAQKGPVVLVGHSYGGERSACDGGHSEACRYSVFRRYPPRSGLEHDPVLVS